MMPYPTIESLPDAIKGLPKHAQEIWQSAFNAAFEQYNGDEAKSAGVAWAAVKKSYEKKGGQWVKKETKAMELTEMLKCQEGKPVMLFPFGRWKTAKYGTMDLNQSFAEQLIENFDSKVLGTQPFFDDGNHDEDKATGWIQRLYIEGEALYAKVDWTPLGVQLLGDKIYQYSSIHVDQHKNPEDGKTYYPVLKNVSLTNIPVLRMLPAIELSELVDVPLNELADPPKTGQPKTDIERLMAHFGISEEEATKMAIEAGIKALLPKRGEKIKQDEQEEVEKKMEKELRDMLGLDENADVLETIKALKVKAEKPDPVTLSEYQKTSEEVKNLTQKLAERDRDDAVSTAIKAGKVTPAQGEWAREYAMADPSGFAKFVEGAPVAIKLGEKGGDGEATIELTEEEIKQAKKFGLSEAELLEGKKGLEEDE